MKALTAPRQERAPRRRPRVTGRQTMLASRTTSRLQIRNMLVPIDFSQSSLEALRSAAPLLRKFRANLHLVHVSPADTPLSGLATMPIVLSEPVSTGRLRSQLTRAANKTAPRLHPARIQILRGEPYEQICGLAREQQIDLIVIATRGQTGLKHLLVGSTAERVVRFSPCPVLVTHQSVPQNGKASTNELRFNKILVPVDFSDCAMKGVQFARDLAKQFDSKLLVMYSVNVQYYLTSDEYARYDYPQLMQQTASMGEARLHELVSRFRRNKLGVDSILTIGHAGDQICDRADKLGVDLIVLSTHGRTGFKHVFLGSTAEFVVQHAHCPVLVVPTRDRPVINSTKHTK